VPPHVHGCSCDRGLCSNPHALFSPRRKYGPKHNSGSGKRQLDGFLGCQLPIGGNDRGGDVLQAARNVHRLPLDTVLGNVHPRVARDINDLGSPQGHKQLARMNHGGIRSHGAVARDRDPL
jgi:hypothetical protein